jgi:arylsulfatase A-like enzyme
MMDRRVFLARAAAAGGALAATPCRAGSAAGVTKRPGKPRGTRPNVVVVVNDDMRATDWRALPKTQKELQGGSWYPQFFSTLPICTPARVSLLTGMYAHNHHVLDNIGSETVAGYNAFLQNGLEEVSLPVILQNAGYYTGLVGKFMHGYDMNSRQPKGWNRWVARSSGGYTGFDLMIDGVNSRFSKREYATDVLARYALEFIANAPADRPFFLHFSPTAPHAPYVPAKRHRNRYPGAVVPRDGSFNEEDVSDKPALLAAQPLLTPEQIAEIDRSEQLRLQMLAATDEAIVALIQSLRKSGRLENTCFFIMSDNGAVLGQHRLPSSKGLPYDPIVRIPMLAWGRPFRQPSVGRLCSHADIGPTVAELAGTSMPGADGKTLLRPNLRDFVPIQIHASVVSAGGVGLRDYRSMYFEYTSGEKEYYDHRRDPRELDNMLRTGGPNPPEITLDLPSPEQLSARLAQVSTCRGSTCP